MSTCKVPYSLSVVNKDYELYGYINPVYCDSDLGFPDGFSIMHCTDLLNLNNYFVLVVAKLAAAAKQFYNCQFHFIKNIYAKYGQTPFNDALIGLTVLEKLTKCHENDVFKLVH